MGDVAPGRRRLLAALVAAVTVAVTGYGLVATGAIARVNVARAGALLADDDPAHRALLRAVDDVQVTRALTARPLDQRLVNVAMVRSVALERTSPAPWLAQLARLGWRDTPALQNRLYAAALAQDLPAIFDASDALLRRQQLMEQMIPILSTVEVDPTVRGTLVERLVRAPDWRSTYLISTGHLRTREQMMARYALLQALRGRGQLTPGEVAANVRAFEQAGMPGPGFALWQGIQPGVTRPLNDMRFLRASRVFDTGEEPVAYEWQMLNGEGYSAGASREDGRATLDIEWSGRGVPVFAQQRTSAMPGRYVLDVGIAAHEVPELSALMFRLMCGDRAILLRQDPRQPTRFATQTAVPCGYPVLQVVGNIQPSATPHQISLRELHLQRTG